ncbi:MAG TPA: sigma-70 family RNA polymerase sigma factor [Candidatus Binatia bacterium]|nr:sigma-70 family RNA polymerase sigma factor [Candidatus Binatia bacterium]
MDGPCRDDLPESPSYLADVLYAGKPQKLALEQEWVEIVHAIVRGDQAALHALYERSHRLVFTLAMRLTGSRETAEEITLDVYHDVWRRAASFDAERGTVLAWVMNQARSRTIDRLRMEQRKKRVDLDGATSAAVSEDDPTSSLDIRERGQLLRDALHALTPHEREAIETAFFSGLTYTEAADRLAQPVGTIKTRIRAGLSKLRDLLMAGIKE